MSDLLQGTMQSPNLQDYGLTASCLLPSHHRPQWDFLSESGFHLLTLSAAQIPLASSPVLLHLLARVLSASPAARTSSIWARRGALGS